MRFSRHLSVLLTALLSTSSCFASPQAPSGITINEFRIIYPEESMKGVTWSLTNNTDRAYLMQSWIRDVDFASGLPAPETTKAKLPFLVTPPLKRVDPGDSLTLRIRLTQLSLPKDRESVFYLSVKGIPAVSDAENQNSGNLMIAVVNNLKLYYRPEGLPEGGVMKAATQLRFSRQGESLIVDNPTPFYINFSQVSVGGKPISADSLRKLVPPKGQQRYDLAKGSYGAVEWQVMDEKNLVSPPQRQTL